MFEIICETYIFYHPFSILNIFISKYFNVPLHSQPDGHINNGADGVTLLTVLLMQPCKHLLKYIMVQCLVNVSQ
jgi:hypothetical protein